MSELISGKEALIAWFDGQTVFVNFGKENSWHDFEKDTNCSAEIFKNEKYKFRLKPRTITINGIEVPASFKPKVGDEVWFLNDDSERGYGCSAEYDKDIKSYFGWWRTEGEIEQVVAALREVFK